ncbi:MAG: ABC transporter transmembrane domain-containing protein [Myxococcota bacterium]|nr:ABC transporter transmembrane domain-containing protein [Myxococcota bacterium]
MYKRLLGLVRPYWRWIPLGLVAMVVLAATTAAYAFLIGPGISHIVTGGERGFVTVTKHFPFLAEVFGTGQGDLSYIGWILIGVVIIKGIAYGTQFFVIRWVGAHVVVDLRNALFERTLAQDMGFFDGRQQGELVSRFTTDVQQIEIAVVDAMASLLRSSFVVSALVVQCFLLDPVLALAAFVAVPAAAVPIYWFLKVIRRIAREYLESLGQVTARITQAIGAIQLIKASATEGEERVVVDREHERFLSIMLRSIAARGAYSPFVEFCGVIGLALVLWYATDRMALPADHANYLEPEFFVSFFLTLVLIYGPVKEIGRVSSLMATGLGAAERLFEILDHQPEIENEEHAPVVSGLTDQIRFRDVHFAYPGEHSEVPVLQGVDFTLERAQTIALVGPSGSGKSTVLNLIPRFYDVTSGAIEFDGADLRALDQFSLRRQMAIVSQDVVLFHESIRYNIAYGCGAVTDEAVEEAARAAQAWDFIAEFPQGLDTVVGDRGVRLSGGQRQRIAIARALLRDAPILLLDEATSALDSESERLVQAALDRLMQGRTVLVVAHRLSTVRHADQILVVREGRITDRGTHQELMAQGGYYANQVALE